MIITLQHDDVVNAVRNHIRSMGFSQLGEADVLITKARSTGKVTATVDTEGEMGETPETIRFDD
jgi:hypothetical protein